MPTTEQIIEAIQHDIDMFESSEIHRHGPSKGKITDQWTIFHVNRLRAAITLIKGIKND